MHPRTARRSGPCFTLVELLLVIAIIIILAAILLPVLGRAKWQAKRAVCLSNLRQWGEAAVLFGTDHDGRVPRGIDWYSPACDGGGCGCCGPTAANPARDISDHFWHDGSGSWSGAKHQRGPTYKISYGGVGTWRVGENGVLPALGYFKDARLVYCPGTKRPEWSYSNQPWYLDTDRTWHTTPMSAYWDELTSGRGCGNPWSDSSSATGYAHFLYGRKWEEWTNYPAEHPQATARVEKYWYAPKFSHVASNWRGTSDKNNDFSPLMWACVRIGNAVVPHQIAGEQMGTNGVMIDGSARWISRAEMFMMVDRLNAEVGQSLSYYPSNPSYGVSRFETGINDSTCWGCYGGSKVKFQILARYALTLDGM